MKVHKLTFLPGVLFLQLVRWSGSASADVVRDRVLPDGMLNAQGTRYRLRSVVVHIGPSAASGHYLTYARHEGASEDWWVYNDEVRRQLLEKEVETTQREKSDICFYERMSDADVLGAGGSGAAASGTSSQRGASPKAFETRDAHGPTASSEELKTSKNVYGRR